MDKLSTLSPWIIDVIVAAIILIFAFIRSRIGLYKSVIGIVVVILAIGTAFLGSKILAPTVRDMAWEKIGPVVEEKIDETIAENESEGASGIFSKLFGSGLENLLPSDESGETATNEEIQALDNDMIAKVKLLAETKGKLILEKLVRIALFIVIFLVAWLIFKLVFGGIGKLLKKGDVIRWIDRFGGFLLGLIEIVVILLVVIRVAGLFNISFFNDLSEGTVLLSRFTSSDLTAILNELKSISLNDLKSIKIDELLNIDTKGISESIGGLLENVKK